MEQLAVEDDFAALFRAHHPDLLRYARRRVGPDLADDVVADVYLVAWRRRSDVPADGVRVWLFGVAARVIANHLRAEGRRLRLRSRLYASAPVPGPDGAGERVREALARLRPIEQEVLRLTEWDGLTADEGAVVLGCSPGAFRVRLHRARGRLAEELTAISEEDA